MTLAKISLNCILKDVVSSHSFVRIWNFKCENKNCLFNNLKARPITPKQNRYFEINRIVVLALWYYLSFSTINSGIFKFYINEVLSTNKKEKY